MKLLRILCTALIAPLCLCCWGIPVQSHVQNLDVQHDSAAGAFAARAVGGSDGEHDGKNNVNIRTLPVIMYHSILRSVSSRYVLSPDVLARDLDLVLARGYETVTTRQLIDWGNSDGDLPKHPILITFDDGFYNNLYYAEKILAARGCTAVLNVVGKYTENTIARKEEDHPNYSYLTWDEIGELSARGTFEIGNHTYNMHAYRPRFGVDRIKGETDDDYRHAVTKDIDRQQENLKSAIGFYPVCFAYPFGQINRIVQKTIESMGFPITLTCTEALNKIEKGNPKSLLRLSRYNREPTGTRFGDVVLPAV